MEQVKKVLDSQTTMTEIVMPNQTNPLNNLMGGNLLYLMDICAAVVSQRHANYICVTASVDNVEFSNPIRLGDVVVLIGHINRAFRSSMEVEINVWAENPRTGHKIFTNRAYYTMVALDENLKPTSIPKIEPESEDEQLRFAAAERRRQLRLVLAGRLLISDATELTQFILEKSKKPA